MLNAWRHQGEVDANEAAPLKPDGNRADPSGGPCPSASINEAAPLKRHLLEE